MKLVLPSPVHLRLHDGTPVILRPLLPEDRGRVIATFNRLSPDSTYFRFWTRFRGASPGFIDRLYAADHDRHATWVMIVDGKSDLPGVGGGSYWPSQEDPTLAEVSFTVADEFQGQGAGTFLLAAVWREAQEAGIRRFVAHVLEANHVMQAWWTCLGATAIQHPHGLEMTLQLDESALPDNPTAQRLRHCLAHLAEAPAREDHVVHA